MKTYTIGEMAKICGISARQLRYYDQIGVIRPNYRNPDNGYRYYTEDQIELLFFLNELKKTGISNDSIQRLFINRNIEQLVQELQINLDQVEHEIQESFARYRNIVNTLVLHTKSLAYINGQDAIDSEEYRQYWVSIIKIPECKIVYQEYEDDMNHADRNEYINRVVSLTQLSDSMKLMTSEPKLFIREHSNIDDLIKGKQGKKGKYTFARQILGTDIPDSENIKSFGGRNAICTINIGPPATTVHEAYEIIKRWANDHDTEISDTTIEEYMVDTFSSMDEERFVTRVIVPLKDM